MVTSTLCAECHFLKSYCYRRTVLRTDFSDTELTYINLGRFCIWTLLGGVIPALDRKHYLLQKKLSLISSVVGESNCLQGKLLYVQQQ